MKNVIENFLNPHDRRLKKLENRVEKILSLENDIAKLSDEELRDKTIEFKNRLSEGQSLDDILEEAFAVVREASFRVIGLKHYPVQLMGGIVLHEGDIAQMQTGEGKTLVATLPSYLNALTGEGVWVITVNDYLAQRDKAEMGRIHEFLGLSVGFNTRGMGPIEKKKAYNSDITYGTNSEFGFDYLRDNMVLTKNMIVQRKLNYAIIDEVDSILIDEARTPLIMSGDAKHPSQYYVTVDKFVKSLTKDDFEKDNKTQSIHLTDIGMDKAEKIFSLENIADIKNVELLHHIRQSLSANYGMYKDKDYVVKDEQVVIVDKFTGRLMPGRTFSNGLHQAIEAKEGLEVQKESKTMAMITYQNLFRMFDKISGMTGTAFTEKSEFKEIYGMDVVSIPTNKPIKRIDNTDFIFKTKDAKIKAIVDDIENRYKKGQPVLIGTIYIDESEMLSEILKDKNIPHMLLNAKQDAGEAQIIGDAGKKGAITIATNMAGRGTDIKLEEGVDNLGGLYVIGAEKHESRRIDNQLRGRSGRQGDNGESRFYTSLEDSIFQKIDQEHLENINAIVDKLGFKENEHIEDKLVSKSIEGVQRDIESMNFRIRKNTLEFDQILNKQRQTIYAERNKILNGEDMSEFVRELIKDVLEKIIDNFTSNSPYPEEWDLNALTNYLNKELAFKNRVDFSNFSKDEIESLDKDKLKDIILSEAYNIYKEKEESYEDSHIRYLERLILMRSIDEKWIDHLDLVEQLRQAMTFQHLGGNHPLRMFNEEAYNMFENMLYEIKLLTIKSLFTLMSSNEEIKVEEIKDEDRLNNIKMLEDKYKVNRNYLYKTPANVPRLKFNLDINASEDVKAKVVLCYMDNGYEQRLDKYEKDVVVNGLFEYEMEKENDLWQMGWYQIKVLVGGVEASNINFLVVAPENIDPSNEEMLLNPNTLFFSYNRRVISFDLEFDDYDKDYIKVFLARNGNEEDAPSFDIRVVDNKAGVEFVRPKNGWVGGFYEVVFYSNNVRSAIPFIIVDEFKEDDEEFYVRVKIKNLDNDELSFIGQIINIDEKKIVANMPLKTTDHGHIKIVIKNDNERFGKGRYEFRLISGEKIALIQYFMIN